MHTRARFWLLLVTALGVLLTAVAHAHPGRRDSNGGHVDRSTGLYHCHTDDCVLPRVLQEEEEEEDLEDALEDEETVPITLAGSWSVTKRWARDMVYEEENTTFYCGCPYTPMGTSGGGEVDAAACGYDGSGHPHAARTTVLEWEHVALMPARAFVCWNEGLPQCSKPGRQCCERHDLNARAMIFDLHNLVPSVGQVNGLRGNRRYGVVDSDEALLGTCDFKWTANLAQPREDRRGDVARVWLYFVEQHGLQLVPGELEMFLRWSEEDPPDAQEVLRNERIKSQQGNGNPFVEMFVEP